tara:strand:- start:8732 stop:9064 length:333 start_codon:yes stop_codon:yes gene_type:complete
MLNFCPECKDLLIPKVEEGKLFIKCGKCDFSKHVTKDLITKEKIRHTGERGEGVVKDENIFATYDNECEECGYGKAEVIDIGVLISDEDNLIFIQCGKCKHVERLGRKTS